MEKRSKNARKMAWKITPLSKRRILERLEVTKNGGEPREVENEKIPPEGIDLMCKLATDVDGVTGKQRRGAIVADGKNCTVGQRSQEP